MKKHTNEYIKTQVQRAIRNTANQQPSFFTGEDVLRTVLKVQKIKHSIDVLYKNHAWLYSIALRALRGVISEELRVKDAKGTRVYEHYQVGADHRWRRLRAMTLPQLRTVVADRQAGIEADQAVVDAYLKIIADLEKLPTGSVVADVLDTG